MVVTRSGKSTTAVKAKVPPEILACIFQYFCSHCCNEYQWPFGPPPGSKDAHDTKALTRLCRVSQSFRNVAQEILFHSFNPDHLPRATSSHRGNRWRFRLEPFLQTAAARPDLARSVKAVFLSRQLYEHLDFWQSRKAFHACVHALGKDPQMMFRKLHRYSTSSVKQAFFRSPEDKWLADGRPQDFCPELFSVLVAILPNLAHLAVSKSSSCRSRAASWDILPGILDSFGVECLPIKTVETHASPKNLLRRCTKLETWITDGWHDFPDMPTVKCLHLRHTERHPRVDYSKCIKACSGNVTIISCAHATENLFEAIDIPRLHDSLEILHLDSRRITPIPSLMNFDKLQYLFLQTHGIYGMIPVSQSPLYSQSIAKILPRNLVVLSVSSSSDTQDRWEQDLCEALASEDDSFPDLEGIISNEEISRKDLAELCDLLGIEWVCRDRRGFPSESSYSSV
ncbi:hypothetical protein NW752_010924 [Fusarium irregulare]|uniref:F-box domain-containing protein n=1 Tax=Fusarium irregulare TaxID=2494466 RepID=A0A9W8PEB8_9HYPO|nr:hypothetical protein NW766_011848 [Fusarium irregulare]KAJ4006276.1 hypothetical protein NW752_010924 [Fusarium irregulare]